MYKKGGNTMISLILFAVVMLFLSYMFAIIDEIPHCTICCIFFLVSLFIIGFRLGYREGQIDAVGRNKINYELRQSADGSSSWECIKNK
jgi:hypothetical protein